MQTTTVTRVPISPLSDAPPRWRVVAGDGRLLGWVQQVATADGTGFSAMRRLPHRGIETELGRFWAFDDAVHSFAA